MASKKPDAKPIAPKKRAKGKGKPNVHTKAKATGLDTSAKDQAAVIPPIVMEIDPQVLASLEERGRPTQLTPELGSRVCTAFARGDTLEEIGNMEGMPGERTIWTWLAAGSGGPNGPLYDAFRHSFTRAKELRAHTRAGKIESYIRRATPTKAERDAGTVDPLDANAARFAVDAQRVLMEIENRAAYGKQVTIKGDPKAPLELRTRHDYSDEELLEIAAGKTIDNIVE